MQTGITRHSNNMNIVDFSCINSEITSFKETTLNQQDVINN